MEPVQKEIDIGVLNRLLRVWKQRKLSSSQQTRILRLLLGIEFKPLMDKDGRYPRGNLSEIGRILSYKTKELFLLDIRKADCFTVKMENREEVEYVSSPLWDRCAQSTGEVGATYTAASSIYNENDNDNVNINSQKEREEEKKNHPLKNLTEVLPENMAKVEAFFIYIKSEPSLYNEFFTTFIEEFKLRKFTHEEAVRITDYMMDDSFKPYFARKPQFLEESNFARVERFRAVLRKTANNWLKSIKGAAMHRLIEETNLKKQRQHNADTNSELWY